MEALTQGAVKAGKTRWLGFSEWHAAQRIADSVRDPRRRALRLEPAAVLPPVPRRPEAKVIPYCRASTASRRSCGARSRRAYSPASTRPGAPKPPTHARRTTRWAR